MKKNHSRAWAVGATVGVLTISGCGGGGGDDSPPPPPPPPPSATASASVVTPASGKTPWSLVTAAQFSLRDAAGNNISGPLNCTSDNAIALTVAADCSSVTGRRLGAQTITVSSGAVSARATLKVIPQPQPIASHGPASAQGSGQVNLVVTTDGRVLAWGANVFGMLGQGLTQTQLASLSLPTAVKDTSGQGFLTGIVSASAGEQSALAVTEDGEVYSWGSNLLGALGRIAPNGDTLPGKVADPTGTGTLHRIVAVSIGESNAVALADDGAVYSWGFYSGQSGSDPKLVPGQVNAVGAGGALVNAVAVSAGWNWSAALLADGRIVTWGFASDGRLGQPSVTTPSAPPGFVIDQSTSLPLAGVVAISAGYNFGMALSAGGGILGWGADDSGQIGQNTASGANPYRSAVPVKGVGGVGTLSDITMVAAGGRHALALDSTGRVFSWGAAGNGELGDGTNMPRATPSPLPAPVVSVAGTGQLNGIIAIAAGYQHSLAFTNDGSLLIWGSGFRGNLGQGGTTQTDSRVPLTVKNEAGSASLSLAPVTYWPNIKQRGL